MRSMRAQVSTIAVMLLIAGAGAYGQRKSKDKQAGYDRAARATPVHPAIVYVAADDNASHIAEVLPGHEVVVMERNGDWVRVFANTDEEVSRSQDAPVFGNEAAAVPVSGWMQSPGVVSGCGRLPVHGYLSHRAH